RPLRRRYAPRRLRARPVPVHGPVDAALRRELRDRRRYVAPRGDPTRRASATVERADARRDLQATPPARPQAPLPALGAAPLLRRGARGAGPRTARARPG